MPPREPKRAEFAFGEPERVPPQTIKSLTATGSLPDNSPMPATEDELKKAFKAFKKKVKGLQLEDDSKLGHSPLTGARSKIASVQPPLGFGREIWEELVDKGMLVSDGGGFYALAAGK